MEPRDIETRLKALIERHRMHGAPESQFYGNDFYRITTDNLDVLVREAFALGQAVSAQTRDTEMFVGLPEHLQSSNIPFISRRHAEDLPPRAHVYAAGDVDRLVEAARSEQRERVRAIATAIRQAKDVTPKE